MKKRIALLALLLPVVAAAQDVKPGDGTVNGKLLKTGAWSMSYAGSRAGTELPAITVEYSLTPVKYNNQDALLFIQKVNMPNRTGIDSIWVKPNDLTSIAHHGMRGERVIPPDAFDGGIIDVVLAALPLKDGYKARMPFYIQERGGTGWYDVTVKDGGANWIVSMDSNGTQITEHIEKATRQFVSGEMYNAQSDIKVVLKRI